MRLALLLALAAGAQAACTLAVEERDGARWEVYTVQEGGDLQRGPIRGLIKLVTGPHGIGGGEQEFLLLPVDRLVAIAGKLRSGSALEFDLGQTATGFRRVRVVADDRIKSYQAILDLVRESRLQP